MKLLSIDSAGTTAAVAVTEGQALLAEGFADAGLTHSQMLLPLVDETLKKAGLSLEEIGCFAVTNGPGSFTGLRIGASLVKGMALGRPCIPVPTLMALAFNEEKIGKVVVSILDARCKQVYMGAYSFAEEGAISLIPDGAYSLEEAREKILSLAGEKILLGDGAYLLAELADGKQITMSDKNHILGKSIAAAARFLQPLAPEKLVPAYFRLSQAEREYQMRKNKGE